MREQDLARAFVKGSLKPCYGMAMGLLLNGVMNETSRVVALSASRRRSIVLLVGFSVFRLPLMSKYVNRI